MTTTETTIDLTPFCSPADGEWTPQLARPFVAKGFRYGTNGLILVRVPAAGEPDSTPPPNRPFPPVAEFFAPAMPPDAAWPWPAGGLVPQSEECWECDGNGSIGREICRACNGDGRDEVGDPCEPCEGTGRGGVRDLCDNCDGSGWQGVGRRVGGHLINVGLDRLVRSLPNVRFWAGQDRGKPLRFLFDGGEGCVMGRREPNGRREDE